MLKVAVVIPTYHRIKSVIKQMSSFSQSAKSNNVEFRFYWFMQDASQEDCDMLPRLMTDNTFNIIHSAKYENPIIGKIRADAINASMHEMIAEQGWEPDLVHMVDDDIWFSDDISMFEKALVEFNHSHYDMAFIRSFKNRKYKIVDVYDIRSDNNTAPATDLGILFKGSDKMFWLFDKTFQQISVGEDCYLLFKGLAMGWKAAQITGINSSFTWDDNWLLDTSQNGGGIHEVALERLGSVPKDMCTRNELLSRSDNSYVQWHCADMFHYEAAASSFRRIRPGLYGYLNDNCEATEDAILRKPGAGIMPYDGTNRVVFGLDKPYDYLPDLNDKWVAWATANSLF